MPSEIEVAEKVTRFGRVLPDRKRSLVSATVVDALNDAERLAVLEFFAEHPDAGYKSALHAVQISATKAEARALLHGDEEIREARFKRLSLDEGSLFKRLGEIAADGEHKDQFRAVTWGLNAIHRWAENQSVEHEHEHRGTVVVEHERRLKIDDVIELASELRRVTRPGGGAGRELPAPREILPASEDG